MKKLIVVIVVSICLLGVISLASTLPDTPEEEISKEQFSVYSFTGSNGLVEISNGVIVLGTDNEIFDGGNLQMIRTELFSDVASYFTAFYLKKDGEERTILTHGVDDMTGGSVTIEGDLGRISGDGVIIGNGVENIDELLQSLYFELRVTDLNGRESVYTFPLNLTKITS